MKCKNCKRPALFRAGGKKGNRRLHADRDHDLCFRCVRDLENKLRKVQAPFQRQPFHEITEEDAKLLEGEPKPLRPMFPVKIEE